MVEQQMESSKKAALQEKCLLTHVLPMSIYILTSLTLRVWSTLTSLVTPLEL